MKLHPLVNQLAMLTQKRAQKQTQILDEILLIITTIFVRFLHVGCQWQHLQHTTLPCKSLPVLTPIPTSTTTQEQRQRTTSLTANQLYCPKDSHGW